MRHVEQGCAVFFGQQGISRQGPGDQLEIGGIGMFLANGAHGRPADGQFLKGPELGFDGVDGVQAIDIGDEIQVFLTEADMAGLDNDGPVALILQVGDGGERALDSAGYRAGMSGIFFDELLVFPAVPPDLADNVGGEGNLDRGSRDISRIRSRILRIPGRASGTVVPNAARTIACLPAFAFLAGDAGRGETEDENRKE